MKETLKTADLRIGNLIYGVSDRIEIIREIHYKGGIETSPLKINTIFRSNIEDISPIELNEEWLIKLGFEKTITITKEFNFEYIDYRMGQFVCFLLPDKRLEVEFSAKHNTIDERGYLTTVKYIHQLQNLFFALTGEELTIL